MYMKNSDCFKAVLKFYWHQSAFTLNTCILYLKVQYVTLKDLETTVVKLWIERCNFLRCDVIARFIWWIMYCRYLQCCEFYAFLWHENLSIAYTIIINWKILCNCDRTPSAHLDVAQSATCPFLVWWCGFVSTCVFVLILVLYPVIGIFFHFSPLFSVQPLISLSSKLLLHLCLVAKSYCVLCFVTF